jgi:ketosteroid isomerase-like protein
VSSNSSEAIVGDFIARINAHDARGVVAMCTPDHVFIDSLGTRITDLPKLEAGWSGYFALFPDYRIDAGPLISADRLVLLTGWASASHPPSGRSWRVPAAWRALISDNLVAEWQVYADNKPVYEILAGGS